MRKPQGSLRSPWGLTAISDPAKEPVAMTPPEAYQRLIKLYREARLLESIGSLLGWDERTYMPAEGLGRIAPSRWPCSPGSATRS